MADPADDEGKRFIRFMNKNKRQSADIFSGMPDVGTASI